jgi:hypothetical protein
MQQLRTAYSKSYPSSQSDIARFSSNFFNNRAVVSTGTGLDPIDGSSTVGVRSVRVVRSIANWAWKTAVSS